MQSQAPTNVDMSTCLREAALPKRTHVDWNWPIWREKISKNRLICKNDVALAYYGSCRLLVMAPVICCGKMSKRRETKTNLPSKVQDKIHPAKEQSDGAYFISDSSFTITWG